MTRGLLCSRVDSREAGRVQNEKALKDSGEGTDTPTAKKNSNDPVKLMNLMKEVLDQQNLNKAYAKLLSNKGARTPGVDGMTVQQLKVYVQKHWSKIEEQLRNGTYQPLPVKRVEIPKPGGGVRKLGIPSALDRLLQQAVLQVLQPIFDPTFSDHSYGFRPGPSAHQAVAKAQEYQQEGYRWVVDMDLEKFFDRVHHDRLMASIAERIDDKELLKLIRAFLTSGVMENGLVQATEEGTPQGVALKPQPRVEFCVPRKVLEVPRTPFTRHQNNLTSRTAVVRTRTPGGVGGGIIPPYPDS